MESEGGLVGRRIAIWGITGCGKTTLSRRLGAALGLEVIQLDAIRHARGWDSVDWPEFRSLLEAKLDAAEDGWICEGSYAPIMDVYLSRIDTMIWMGLPLRVTFPRLLRRTIGRARKRLPVYGPGSPCETLWQSFASKDSILLYALMTHRQVLRRRRARVAELPDSIRVLELCSPREVERFVSEWNVEEEKGPQEGLIVSKK